MSKIIKVSEELKTELDKIKGDNTYNDVISNLLINSDYSDFLKETNQSKKALFYMGLLTRKTYGDNLNQYKIFDEIQKLSNDNFMKVYSMLVAENTEKELDNDFLITLTSESLLKSKQLRDVDSDEIPYYFSLGLTAKN